MLKPNYCEECKYQFKTGKELLAHIQLTHRNGPKSSNPAPVNNMVEAPENVLAFYLRGSAVTREVFGVGKTEHGLEVSDHEKFMKLEFYQKELVNKAIIIANRRK